MNLELNPIDLFDEYGPPVGTRMQRLGMMSPHKDIMTNDEVGDESSERHCKEKRRANYNEATQQGSTWGLVLQFSHYYAETGWPKEFSHVGV